MNKINLIKIGAYTDGGTTMWINEQDKDILKTDLWNTVKIYYLDKKFSSPTKGKLLNKYPCPEVEILDVDNFNFIQ